MSLPSYQTAPLRNVFYHIIGTPKVIIAKNHINMTIRKTITMLRVALSSSLMFYASVVGIEPTSPNSLHHAFQRESNPHDTPQRGVCFQLHHTKDQLIIFPTGINLHRSSNLFKTFTRKQHFVILTQLLSHYRICYCLVGSYVKNKSV